jgi:hypothetical protein
MGVMFIRGAAFVSLPKEKTVRYRFETKVIDEKAMLMHLLHLYKGGCSEKCWPFWSFIKWNSLFINVREI